MNLAGLDVGFSERRRSNALATYDGRSFAAWKFTLSDRNEALTQLAAVDVIAVDAPLVPANSDPTVIRACERTFIRGAFQTRCKPAMSHVKGTGRELRQHGSAIFSAIAALSSETQVVEAFPNTFLGVVLSDAHHLNRGPLKRGKKSDWLYEKWIEDRLFDTVIREAQLSDEFAEICIMERDHDQRAAFICLLTAAFVARGDYVAVGDAVGGYFYLPPRRLWAPWAWSEVSSAASRSGAEVLDHSSGL